MEGLAPGKAGLNQASQVPASSATSSTGNREWHCACNSIFIHKIQTLDMAPFTMDHDAAGDGHRLVPADTHRGTGSPGAPRAGRLEPRGWAPHALFRFAVDRG
jgi:hypothetical protein